MKQNTSSRGHLGCGAV